jgi:hypothetical protein
MIYFSGCWFSLVYGKKWIPGYDSGPEYRLVYDWSRVLSGEELTADSELARGKIARKSHMKRLSLVKGLRVLRNLGWN